jgi:hypothetical protein
MDTQKVFGEIFSKADAEAKFGPALESVKFTVSELKAIMAKTKGYIMFKFEPGKLYIFDNKRNLIYTNTEPVHFGAEVVLKIYSISVLEKLIANATNNQEKDGDDPDIEVERREEVITTSTEQQTMEVGGNCPPDCPTD